MSFVLCWRTILIENITYQCLVCVLIYFISHASHTHVQMNLTLFRALNCFLYIQKVFPNVDFVIKISSTSARRQWDTIIGSSWPGTSLVVNLPPGRTPSSTWLFLLMMMVALLGGKSVFPKVSRLGTINWWWFDIVFHRMKVISQERDLYILKWARTICLEYWTQDNKHYRSPTGNTFLLHEIIFSSYANLNLEIC